MVKAWAKALANAKPRQRPGPWPWLRPPEPGVPRSEPCPLTGVELVKREITVADHTATSIDVTLWGDRAKQEDNLFDNKPPIVGSNMPVAW